MWQTEQNSAVCVRMNGLRKTRRCGSGFSLITKSCSARATGFFVAASSCSFGILQIEIGLAHGALHAGDGVAHHAAQSGLRFRTMHDLLDRRIHHAAVEHRGIVASTAPFRGLGADRVLHVLDRLAVPLIVERRKMVRRAEPLVVDIFVAALAGVGLHEKLAGNFLLSVDLRRTGKERTLRTVALAIHVVGRHGGILNSVARLPTLADVAGTIADPRQGQRGRWRRAEPRRRSGNRANPRLPKLSAIKSPTPITEITIWK